MQKTATRLGELLPNHNTTNVAYKQPCAFTLVLSSRLYCTFPTYWGPHLTFQSTYWQTTTSEDEGDAAKQLRLSWKGN